MSPKKVFSILLCTVFCVSLITAQTKPSSENPTSVSTTEKTMRTRQFCSGAALGAISLSLLLVAALPDSPGGATRLSDLDIIAIGAGLTNLSALALLIFQQKVNDHLNPKNSIS